MHINLPMHLCVSNFKFIINPRRVCAGGLYSTSFVCLFVCFVCLSFTTSLAHLAAESLKFGPQAERGCV